jgi:hypothetical protein
MLRTRARDSDDGRQDSPRVDHDENGEPAEPGAVGPEATAAPLPDPMNSLSAVVIWANVDANAWTCALVA